MSDRKPPPSDPRLRVIIVPSNTWVDRLMTGIVAVMFIGTALVAVSMLVILFWELIMGLVNG